MKSVEYRSRLVTFLNEGHSDEDKIEKTCNAWLAEGFEVFSIIVPNPSNYSTYRLTARRIPQGSSTLTEGRKFRV